MRHYVRLHCVGCGKFRRSRFFDGYAYCDKCAEDYPDMAGCDGCGALVAVHLPACPLCGTSLPEADAA